MESTRRELPLNPRQSASLLSVLFFAWTLPIYKKSRVKKLDTDDLYAPIDVDRSNELGDRLDR